MPLSVRRTIEYGGLFVIVFALATFWQFTMTLGDPDGFYHARMALFLRDGIILKQMPWMHLSTLRDAFTDHQFLYHVLLIPFVSLGKPLIGVKLATVYFAAGFAVVFHWLLRQWRVHWPMVWTVAVMLCTAFSFRISLVKANTVSLIVVLLFLWALFERRWYLLSILSMVYVWLYGAWILAALIVASYTISVLVHRLYRGPWRRRFWRRDHYRPEYACVAVIIGTIAGIVFSPYWPQDVPFYWQQVWQIAIVGVGRSVLLAGEWTNLKPDELVPYFSYIGVFYFFSLFAFIRRHKKPTVRILTLFILSAIAIVFTIKSRRYIELSIPLMALFSAVVFTEVEGARNLRRMWSGFWKRIRVSSIYILVVLWVGSLFLMLLALTFLIQMNQVRAGISTGIPMTKYGKVSAWLSEHTPEYSIVAHASWDDWPMLFYFSRHNRYLNGLDPVFMYNYDRSLYARWASFTQKGESDDPVTLVSTDLNARYVLLSKKQTRLQHALETNLYFEKVYEDDEVWVYHVTDQAPSS